jgi:hypothetical protein
MKIDSQFVFSSISLQVRTPNFESDYFDHPVERFISVMRVDDVVRRHVLQGCTFIQRLLCEALTVLMAIDFLLQSKRLTKIKTTETVSLFDFSC